MRKLFDSRCCFKLLLVVLATLCINAVKDLYFAFWQMSPCAPKGTRNWDFGGGGKSRFMYSDSKKFGVDIHPVYFESPLSLQRVRSAFNHSSRSISTDRTRCSLQ